MWFGMCVQLEEKECRLALIRLTHTHTHSLHTGLFLATVALFAQPLCSVSLCTDPPFPPTFFSSSPQWRRRTAIHQDFFGGSSFSAVLCRNEVLERDNRGTEMQVNKEQDVRWRRGKRKINPAFLHLPFSLHWQRYWYVCLPKLLSLVWTWLLNSDH